MSQTLNIRALLIAAAVGATMVAGAAALVAAAGPMPPILWTLDPTDPRVSLEDVEREVIRRHPVPDIAPASLATMLANGKATLFDVRTQEEYETGHLPGAIRVEPGRPAADILKQHRDRLGDGPVVFYCAVGVRSAQMLSATLRQITPHAGAGVYNLRGGMFRWAADGRALVKGQVSGEPAGGAPSAEPGKLHPFDNNWGQLLARTLAR